MKANRSGKVKKICMVAYTFYETDNRVRRYAEALAGRGDHVEAFALWREGQKSFEIIRGVRVYRIQKRLIDESGPFTYLRKLITFFLRSAWYMTVSHIKKPYDLIHVHSVPDFQVFATIIPRLLGTRVILDIHDIVPEFYASKFKVSDQSLVFRCLLLAEKLSIAYSNHVIVSNHLWLEKLTKRAVQSDKCTAIINYPDLSIFSLQKEKSQANEDFLMCYPGTLNSHQGLNLAIDAVALLQEQKQRLKFLIIGDGPDREKLKTMVQTRHLQDRVEMRDFVSIEDVAETMKSVDLGVVPKRKDSFGNEAFSTKIMEFMAMGVPVIASRTSIDQYYFNDGILEFFESGNAEDLAAKILGLMRNPARYAELKRNALEFIARNNWNVKRYQYLDLVDRLTASTETHFGKSTVN
jgi:glycosyltransferase involved in cell wall biosynthesis